MKNDEDYVKSVAQYIEKIRKISDEEKSEDIFWVYRGEPIAYKTHGMPGIFRGDYLKNDPYFEKNILLEMRANKLSTGNNYLEMAIDAQHGGFPSRLLDVSYNCLIALYFACVSKPENKEREKEENAHVLAYRINKVYCPTAANVINNYKEMLENPMGHSNEKIFESNHKFINHIKVNSRIIAQQGALILFQGKEWNPISERNVKRIMIKADKKDDIAKQLEKYFGITTSSIYPEIDYAIDKIKKNVQHIVSDEFSIENELKICFINKKEELKYKLERISEETNQDILVDEIRKLEKQIEAWKVDLNQFKDKYKEDLKKLEKEGKFISVVNEYNKVIKYYEKMFWYYIEADIKSCTDQLMWEDK